MTAYDRLTARFTRIATVREAASVLHWDSEAMMPRGGGPARADQTAVLASIAHGLLIEPNVADDLAEAVAVSAAEPAQSPGSASDQPTWRAANLRLMQRQHQRAVCIPVDLVEARSRAVSRCEQAWREARPRSDFATVAPLLIDVIHLTHEAAQAQSEALGLDPYDALMDAFQPGITTADVEPIFTRYGHFLEAALPDAEARQAAQPAAAPLTGAFSIAAQTTVCTNLSKRIGLDFDHARLDTSAHPFSGGTPTDIRITTRYSTADPAEALYAVVHETGHALYEAGLPRQWARQPVGRAAGMAAHESQSLIIEMQACRSDGFLGWIAPQLHHAFGGDAAAYAPTNLARLWRRVERGLIRVNADEMTYPAHVALRFHLERALLRGDLTVNDLPATWEIMMQQRLGVTPPDNARGCMQDVHWYAGLIGYFPSYTLGAMAAAQLMAAARRDVPNLDAGLAQGDFAPLLGWLRTHVHGMGAVLGFNDLLRHATGKSLDPADFEAHLTRRYLQ
jgi:carboxypeptidase Taq